MVGKWQATIPAKLTPFFLSCQDTRVGKAPPKPSPTMTTPDTSSVRSSEQDESLSLPGITGEKSPLEDTFIYICDVISLEYSGIIILKWNMAAVGPLRPLDHVPLQNYIGRFSMMIPGSEAVKPPSLWRCGRNQHVILNSTTSTPGFETLAGSNARPVGLSTWQHQKHPVDPVLKATVTTVRLARSTCFRRDINSCLGSS